MKKSEVKVGHTYWAKVSDRVVQVRIDSRHSRGGWNATNTATGKRIHVKSAQRLRGATEEAAEEPGADGEEKASSPAAEAAAVQVASEQAGKPKRVSALDAAAEVLQTASEPMNCKDLITSMATRGLWTSPAGKTPHATLYSAILRELATRGVKARFRKVERGRFAFNDGATGEG